MKSKYACRKCGIQYAKTDLVLVEGFEKPQEKEVIKTLPSTRLEISSEGKRVEVKIIFVGRQLECGHYVSIYTMGFTDHSNENLNEHETLIIRSQIDKQMIKKNLEEVKSIILKHVDEYQTLLKLANKQRLQYKYALQYVDQLRDKYSSQMSEEDKTTFDTKFYHFMDLRPTTEKLIAKERKQVKEDTMSPMDKQKAALDAAMAQLLKAGYKVKS